MYTIAVLCTIVWNLWNLLKHYPLSGYQHVCNQSDRTLSSFLITGSSTTRNSQKNLSSSCLMSSLRINCENGHLSKVFAPIKRKGQNRDVPSFFNSSRVKRTGGKPVGFHFEHSVAKARYTGIPSLLPTNEPGNYPLFLPFVSFKGIYQFRDKEHGVLHC